MAKKTSRRKVSKTARKIEDLPLASKAKNVKGGNGHVYLRFRTQPVFVGSVS